MPRVFNSIVESNMKGYATEHNLVNAFREKSPVNFLYPFGGEE